MYKVCSTQGGKITTTETNIKKTEVGFVSWEVLPVGVGEELVAMEKALAQWARESPSVSVLRASQWILAERTRPQREQQFLLADILHRLCAAMDEVALPHTPERIRLVLDVQCDRQPSRSFLDSRNSHEVLKLAVWAYLVEHIPHIGSVDVAVGHFRLV